MKYMTVYYRGNPGWVMRYSDAMGEWREVPWPETWWVGGRHQDWNLQSTWEHGPLRKS